MSAERKVVVVTGASQGIGEGVVRGYLDKGYLVAANSRSIVLNRSCRSRRNPAITSLTCHPFPFGRGAG